MRRRPTRVCTATVVVGVVLAAPLALPASAVRSAADLPPLTSGSHGASRGQDGESDRRPGVRRLVNDVAHSSAGRTSRARSVRSWPGRRIRYWADLPANYERSVALAVASWNRTGLDMTLVRVARARDAQLTITMGGTSYAGEATIGHQVRNWVRLRPGQMGSWRREDQWAGPRSVAQKRVTLANIVTHELGHVLGLHHQGRRCNLMYDQLHFDECPLMDPRPGYFRCGMVDSLALRALVRRYGGRATYGPRACLVDALPPVLRGLTFSGGLDAEAPITIRWGRPRTAPPGTAVHILQAGNDCRFPVARDPYRVPIGLRHRLASVPVSRTVWRDADPSGYPACYGVQVVNASGAGRAVVRRRLTSWIPAPAPPTDLVVRRVVGDEYTFKVEAAVPPGTELALAPPADDGSCVATWPAGEDYRPIDTSTRIHLGRDTGCLSFFSFREFVRPSRTGTDWVLGPEPAPEPPRVVSVRRDLGTDNYESEFWFDHEVATPAVLVRPEGRCETTWPAGADPADHYGESYVEAPGVTRPCLTFFTVNAFGGVGAGVPFQVTAAAGPVVPTVSTVRPVAGEDGLYRTQVGLRSDLTLVVWSAPTGQCVSAWPVGEDPRWHDAYVSEEGTTEVYSDHSRPCFTFFAVNDDGVFSTGVQRQVG